MTTSTTPYCADVSREAGESQFGTAPEKQIWLLLQYDAAWEPKAIKNNNLPPDVKAYLDSILETVPNARMLFIRQTPHPTHEKLAFFVVRTGDQPTAYHFTLNAYDNLLELDIPAIASGAPEYDAHRHTDPLFLVCTHGKRDKCCAHYGLPVYNALKQIEGHTVWQSSHVSGHRFAANVICFPHGVLLWARLPG